MMIVSQQANGLFAVRDISGLALHDVLGLFKTRLEAEEWLLDRALHTDEADNGLSVQKPGNGQGLT
ncbi:hypothetical protein HN018_25475 (plasmid) [Lichenicola cladoniae]|uniref:Uncharacterized protein n=1 Tax=Lichenicola cladoniae TaxID=1484109 RepID=A0A6M8HZC6_9PROT|nr:hypothetical protein [Lichenicola cladoniae]NPD66787.1 hypothetical protein [Acetobacteraceae bacterium]QKE93515.1 hypothetical protein HN018_25475 [Lichenicola cladoniae]